MLADRHIIAAGLLSLAAACGGGQSGTEGEGDGTAPPVGFTDLVECPCQWAVGAVAMRATVTASDACGVTLRLDEVLGGDAEGLSVGDELGGGPMPCSELREPDVGTEVLAIHSGASVFMSPWGDDLQVDVAIETRLARDDIGVLLDRDACIQWLQDHRPSPIDSEEEVVPPEEDPEGSLPEGPVPATPSDDPIVQVDVRGEPTEAPDCGGGQAP